MVLLSLPLAEKGAPPFVRYLFIRRSTIPILFIRFCLRKQPLPRSKIPIGVTAHYLLKPFSCNTYGPPRNCCKQKTYIPAKPFSCNTYRKRGVGESSPLSSPTFRCAVCIPKGVTGRYDVQTFRRGSDLSPFFSSSYSHTSTTATAQLFWNQSITHHSHRDGRCAPPVLILLAPWDGGSPDPVGIKEPDPIRSILPPTLLTRASACLTKRKARRRDLPSARFLLLPGSY